MEKKKVLAAIVIFIILAILGVVFTGGLGGDEPEPEVELEILEIQEEEHLRLEVRMKNLREEEINLSSDKFQVISDRGFEHSNNTALDMGLRLQPDQEDTFTLVFFDFPAEDLEPVELIFEADDTAEPIGWAEI